MSASLAELCMNRLNWRQCKDLVASDVHNLILKAGNLSSDRSTTELLNLTHEYNTKPCAVIAAYLLAVQSDEVPVQAINSYIYEVKHFLLNIEHDHLPFITKELIIICHKTTEILCNIKNAAFIIPILIHTCSLISSSSICLTAIHADVLQACISSKMYSTGMDFINHRTILEINPGKNLIPSADCLRYFYYAGICCLAMKLFDQSLEFFINVATVPANALSTIVTHAIKKARLVSLIANGEDLSLPQFSSSPSTRYMKNPCLPYDDIVRAFISDNHTALMQTIENDRTVLENDMNYGLCMQVYSTLFRQRLIKLPQTYSSILLSDVALICEEQTIIRAEKDMLDLIMSGKISGHIDKKKNVVVFENASVDDSESVQSLIGEVRSTIDLSDQLYALQKRVLTSKQYIAKLTPKTQNEGTEDLLDMGDF